MNITSGKDLKEARLEYGITIKTISDETGISKSLLHKIEQGRRCGSNKTWKRLIEYFEMYSILHEDNEPYISKLNNDIIKYGENQKVRINITMTNPKHKTLKVIDYEIAEEKEDTDGIYTTLKNLKNIT